MNRLLLQSSLFVAAMTVACLASAQEQREKASLKGSSEAAVLQKLQPNLQFDPISPSELPAGKYNGTATNQTVGITDTASFTLHQTSAGTILTGRFGEQQLFGRFQTPATAAWQLNNGVKTGYFSGLLQLGDDGSGFPSGTAYPFKVTLRFTPDGVQGAYVLETPDGIPRMGTLTLQ
jgi:hypothetical protein